MKAVVFAYHDMGCTGIQSLLDAGYDIAAIFTHPDNPGENHFFGSVARLAAEQGIPVWAPEDVNHPLWIERIREMKPDVLFSFYYRNLLGDEILNLAPKGAFNLHGSLLPKNPKISDYLIEQAAKRKFGEFTPNTIDDSLVEKARASAASRPR